MDILKKMVYSEDGQGMAEYALVLVLIAIACIGVTRILGENITSQLNDAANQIRNVN